MEPQSAGLHCAKAIVVLSDKFFESGQAYVALSRVGKLEVGHNVLPCQISTSVSPPTVSVLIPALTPPATMSAPAGRATFWAATGAAARTWTSTPDLDFDSVAVQLLQAAIRMVGLRRQDQNHSPISGGGISRRQERGEDPIDVVIAEPEAKTPIKFDCSSHANTVSTPPRGRGRPRKLKPDTAVQPQPRQSKGKRKQGVIAKQGRKGRGHTQKLKLEFADTSDGPQAKRAKSSGNVHKVGNVREVCSQHTSCAI